MGSGARWELALASCELRRRSGLGRRRWFAGDDKKFARKNKSSCMHRRTHYNTSDFGVEEDGSVARAAHDTPANVHLVYTRRTGRPRSVVGDRLVSRRRRSQRRAAAMRRHSMLTRYYTRRPPVCSARAFRSLVVSEPFRGAPRTPTSCSPSSLQPRMSWRSDRCGGRWRVRRPFGRDCEFA